MDFYIGGYFIVQGSTPSHLANPSMRLDEAMLPLRIWSLSNCICHIHPIVECLSWVNDNDKPNKLERYQKALKLTSSELKQFMTECDDLFKQNKLGWQEMFFEPEPAMTFAKKYLSWVPDIKILQIATTAEYRDIILESENPSNQAVGLTGVYECLQAGKISNHLDHFRGFEILGFETGVFHSFYCDNFHVEISKSLNIQLNQYGLISDLTDAIKANDYIDDPEHGAESAYWLPWAITEITTR
ncbi:hypothetical protein [Candidatus Berkiella aquae]|uniref:Uncharacterized protein n=1 Tax=Candidatus Berkiella aquae TaxID=295108 RepID=A0A0Q9YX31_9GAMM|nr:hypothetical protein [Candidatus Berkiella aquae]MCS5711455.1 hypothetical protein [Candidatus Berkiella aquae]